MSSFNKYKKIIIIFIIILSAGSTKAEIKNNYKELRNPFRSNIPAEETDASGVEKKKKTEEAEDAIISALEIIEKETAAELNRIEVAAIMGNKKGYLVLFKEDSRIYKKNDYINKDKMIKIDKVDADSVKLSAELENGKKLALRIPLKLK